MRQRCASLRVFRDAGYRHRARWPSGRWFVDDTPVKADMALRYAYRAVGQYGRFHSSRQAVRFTGLDVTVYSSNGKRSPGHLSRQGPPVLRWCLYEA